jgi:hypothetical protein
LNRSDPQEEHALSRSKKAAPVLPVFTGRSRKTYLLEAPALLLAITVLGSVGDTGHRQSA